MSKIFETQFEKGSYLDRAKGLVLTPTDAPFERTSKGLAAKFNGTSSKVVFTETNFGTTHTIIQWIKFDEVASNMILFSNVGSTSYINYRFSTNLIRCRASSGDYTNWTIPDMIANTWYQVVVVRTEQISNLYFDGAFIATDTLTDNLDFIATQMGGYTANYMTGSIAKTSIYDNAFTAQEVIKDYNRFLQATSVAIEKYPSYNPFSKPSDLSSVSDLIAAYNMIPSTGGVLVDISDNDGNGVITGPISTLDGLRFDGVDDTVPLFIEAGIAATVKTVCFRIKLDTTTEEILEGGTGTELIYAAAGTLVYDDYSTAYINGIETDTVVANQWMNIVITSETSVSNVTATLGLNVIV